MDADASAEIQLIRALGHTMRRSILREMGGEEEISPRELSDRMEVSLVNVSYHVRILADCGAITLVRTRPVRGSMQHFYRFAVEAEWAYGILGLAPPSPPGD